MISHYNPLVAWLFIAYIIASMASAPFLLGYAVYKILKRRKQMNGSGTKNKECESCCYFGRASDAPETVEEECMYIPAEEDDWIPPCERR